VFLFVLPCASRALRWSVPPPGSTCPGLARPVVWLDSTGGRPGGSA